jgi:glutamate-1-semialdehyde 2,1-aminomutase
MTLVDKPRARAAGDRYAESRALYDRAKRSLAGGVSSQFRALNLPHPMFYERALGSRVWDVDGNELIDFTLSQGPCILGHSHPELLERVGAALAKGQLFAGQHRDELELAEALQRLIPAAEFVRFGSSGSEAAHGLLRLARHVTGKPKFIKFTGHYHGWLDNVSFNVSPPRDLSNDPTRPIAWGGGIPAALAGDVIPLPWNNLALVEETLARHGGEVAAIITEPAMCNQGCIEPAEGFLQGLRDLCDQYDVALIFDEIICGFRLAMGGGQDYYGVTPDMALFGKALGAGFPISALVGKDKYMRPLVAGEVYHAGTLNGNNGSVAAALTAIDVLGRNDRAGLRHIARIGRMLRDGLEDIAARAPMPILIQGPGAMFHMGFTTQTAVTDYDDVLNYDRKRYGEFCQRMLARGFRLIERGLWYVSTAHSEEDVLACLAAVEDTLTEMGP